VRGSPFLRSLCAVCVLLLAAVPLWRLTHRKAAANVAPRAVGTDAHAATADVPVQMRIEFTSPPRTLRVVHLARELWVIENPPALVEQTVRLPWPPEGIDLRVQIEWPNNAPLAAARVVVLAPDRAEFERSIWGRGPVDEVLTFP
jgi:hypothetical protein